MDVVDVDNMQGQLLWLQRRSYLTVLEGLISDVDVTLPVDSHHRSHGYEGHVVKYLFNEMIAHELCAFLSY